MIAGIILSGCNNHKNSNNNLTLNDSGYFEAVGINYLVFNNWYNGMFSDSKMSGIEIIHHGVRTATNGDVRLSPTPEQWDAIPTFVERNINPDKNTIEAVLSYPEHHFTYRVKTESSGNRLTVRVVLDDPLPLSLEGKAGFNVEFLPSAYFKKTFYLDNNCRVFPLYPGGPMTQHPGGDLHPQPLASGRKLVLAPEDPERRVIIESLNNDLSIYDGRNVAQNGWFVVRSHIPACKTGVVIEWTISASSLEGWTRTPVIGHSQAGYHPNQAKVAVIESGPGSRLVKKALLYRISEEGSYELAFQSMVKPWGKFLRYNYGSFDFSEIDKEGIYVIEYDGIRTKPFLIDSKVFNNAWQLTLDIFFPVQMDHMFVNEAYCVWHGAAHLDDALTMTDNLVYDPALPESKPDDRWAFTSRSTPLNYGSAAALAAASRALAGSNPDFAEECLQRAEQVWEEEHMNLKSVRS